MLRTLLFVSLVIALAHCQVGGTRGPCSAVAIPGPFSEPISVFGTTLGAAASAVNCNSDDLDDSPAVWYTIAPAAGSSVSITSCSSYTNFDTVVIVYSGNCEDLSCVALGDDNDCTANPEAGAVTFVSTGQQYFVTVVGWGGSTGQFELTFSETVANSSSSCQGAIVIPGPYVTPVTIFGNTQSSTGYSQNICGLTSSSYIDWYVITPMPGSQVEVSTCNSITDFDTRLSVLTGACGSLTCQFENDDNCTSNTYASYLTFISNQPSYYLAVFGYSTNSGSYEVRIAERPVQGTPGGDCGTAILLPFAPGSSQLFFGATTNNPVSSAAACSTITSPSSWYRVDVPSNYGGTITASTCNPGTSFDTILSVYGGSCERLYCVAQNDDYTCTVVGLASTVFFDIYDIRAQELEAGVIATSTPTPTRSPTRNSPPSASRTPSVQAGTVSFFIQVAGFGTSSGSYTLSVSFS